jgi:phenylalanyl-tRNA synthetase beta chain
MQKKVSAYLSANGFFEILNNSLTHSAYNEKYNPEISPEEVRILNPLSNELNVMRTSLLFSSLESLQYNVNRKSSNLKFFEFGKTYQKNKEKFIEENHLSIAVYGKRHDENWHKQNQSTSFYFLKSVIENVIAQFGKTGNHWLHFTNIEHSTHSLSLEISYNHKPIGTAGIIKQAVLKQFDLSEEVFYAELNTDALMKLPSHDDLKISEIPKFPEVKRDLSMVVSKDTNYIDIRNLAFQSEKKLLRTVNIFDVYEGEKIEQGKKSYALSFILRDDEKTLEDKQIDSVMNKLIQTFESKIGAIVRK